MGPVVEQPIEHVFWTEFLDDKQTAAVKNFHATLKEERLLEGDVKGDLTSLCRFLHARKWDIPKAVTMWRDMIEWRRAGNVDPPDPPFRDEEIAAIRTHYPHFYHKTDKHGRPVNYEMLGSLRPVELLKVVTVQRLVTFHIQGWEYARARVMPACSYAKQREVFTFVTVLDLKGLKMTSFTKEVRQFISAIANIDQNYYPEHLGTMLIINAPMMFSGIWSVIKPWLESRTQKKIQVISSEKQSTAALQALIPKENLLKRYGGDSEFDAPYNGSFGPWADTEIVSKALKSEYAGNNGGLIGARPELVV